MAKTQPDTLLEEIAPRFQTYLRRGVRVDEIVDAAHPDLRVDNPQTLVRIHFVLTRGQQTDGPRDVGVVDFVDRLEGRLRRINTSTSRSRERIDGEIRGHVDWHRTLKARQQEGATARQTYVCQQPEENYTTDENLVLGRLLDLVHEILFEDLGYALSDPERYEWLSPWVDSSTESSASGLAETLDRIYSENIYLQRISTDERTVTSRILEDVKQSRQPLYREAAQLLDQYRRLVASDLSESEVGELLNRMLVEPSEEATLFELYWIFKILDAYGPVEYKLISEGVDNTSVVAEWSEGNQRYVLYHDSVGDAVQFRESLNSIEAGSGFVHRLGIVQENWQSLRSDLFGQGGIPTLWGGRPDILIERYGPDQELEQLFIGEVKYTRDTGYASRGLRELLEYMAFVQNAETEGDYIEAEVFDGTRIAGGLFVDTLDTAELPDESAGSVSARVFQFGQEPEPGRML